MGFFDDHLTVRDGHLCLDGVDLAALSGEVDTPFYVVSESALRERAAAVLTAFVGRHPPARVFFASKACSNLWVLGVARGSGLGVEVNSGGELEKAVRAGFAAEHIVFNGVAKTRDEIGLAVRLGVRALLVDSLCELERIGGVAEDVGRTAAVAPRIDVHVAALTHPGLETAFGGKAGIDRDDAVEAFRRAAADPWLDPCGLHLHLGSQITGVAPYAQAMETALDLVDEVERATGPRLRFVDAGGGFAVPYDDPLATSPDQPGRPTDRQAQPDAPQYFTCDLTFDDYAEAVCGPLLRRRGELGLIVEPGRSIAAPAGVLVTRVESEKTKRLRDARGRVTGEVRWLTVDAGFNTLLEHTNYGWYYRSRVAGRAGEPHDTPFRLAGPLCDGGDVFAGDGGTPFRLLPASTTVGDTLVFRDTGAYTLEMMNDYNARPRAAAFAVTCGGDVLEIRRRETVDDLVRLDRSHASAPGGR